VGAQCFAGWSQEEHRRKPIAGWSTTQSKASTALPLALSAVLRSPPMAAAPLGPGSLTTLPWFVMPDTACSASAAGKESGYVPGFDVPITSSIAESRMGPGLGSLHVYTPRAWRSSICFPTSAKSAPTLACLRTSTRVSRGSFVRFQRTPSGADFACCAAAAFGPALLRDTAHPGAAVVTTTAALINTPIIPHFCPNGTPNLADIDPIAGGDEEAGPNIASKD
jgi:hypothetical protein